MPMRFIEARDGYSVYDNNGERVYRRNMTWLDGNQRRHVRWEDTDRYHLTVEMAVEAAQVDGLTLDEVRELVPENMADEVTECFKCDDVAATGDTATVDGNPWCESCASGYDVVGCEACSEQVSVDYLRVEGGGYCCDGCHLNGAAYYCEDHDLYYWADDGCETCAEEGEDCYCESPMHRFSIAGIGGFRYASGEYHEVHADAGIVSEAGYGQILSEVVEWVTEQYPGVEGHTVYMCDCGEEGTEHETHATHYWVRDAARSAMRDVWYADPSYRSEAGTTIAKRLRAEVYRRTKGAGLAVSLPAALVAKIGTIARQHSEGANVLVDITRDLNAEAEEFVNEDSCWWSDYSYSRCTLKSNAGFGLRSFGDGTNSYATGRAWVFGCTVADDGRLVPTFADAEAYVVFNGYGDLEEYRGAQVLATMLGWSARTETLPMTGTGDVMYINSGSARVVAPAEVLARTDLHFSGAGMSRHAHLPIPATV